jgi:hypothetical protein
VTTIYRGVKSGKTITASGVAKGANYGLEVSFTNDADPVIDGERYERVVDGSNST